MVFDWTKFSKKIAIHSDVETVYLAWATRSGMESWFLRSCIYSRDGETLGGNDRATAGDSYTFLWHGWTDDTVERGTILQANGIDDFTFTFDGNGSTHMKVNVKISENNGLVLVDLQQFNIPLDEQSRAQWFLGCSEGWTFYLTNLKSILEGGLDLRNKDIELKGVINA